tara:strand:+ start:158 stop:763 length:606 start_codon:yes stop_codon:yes gene_type:complete
MSINVCNNNSLSAITSLPASISGGAMTLLETQTASSSSTISFTSNIDSTYKEYIFKFYNIHPATDNAYFQFQASSNSGSSYGITTTNTYFRGVHTESDSEAAVQYIASYDLAQSTNFININTFVGNDNDHSVSGTLHLFDPSNTTFVKHYLSNSNRVGGSDVSVNVFAAGYLNTTSVIDAVQFKFHSGNIDSGTIKLYGIK